jgi:hypothetical protein
MARCTRYNITWKRFSVTCGRSLIVECSVKQHSPNPLFYFGHCFVCSSLIYGFWLPLWYLQTFLPIRKKRHDGNGMETHVLQRTTNNHKTLLNDKVVHYLQGVWNSQCKRHHSRPLLGIVVHLIRKHNKRMILVEGLYVCTGELTPYFYIMGVTVFSSICRTELSIIYNILLNLFKMSEEKSLLISVFIVLFSINRV